MADGVSPESAKTGQHRPEQRHLDALRVRLLDDQLRYQIARLALHDEEGIVASNYELHLPKPSYTWNTLQHLHQDFPQHTFLLLIGGDNWALFPRWYKAQEIMDGHDIVVYPRRGCQIDRAALPPRVTIADTELLDISSTDIRQGIKQGSNISRMVPSVIIPLVSKLYSDCE